MIKILSITLGNLNYGNSGIFIPYCGYCRIYIINRRGHSTEEQNHKEP